MCKDENDKSDLSSEFFLFLTELVKAIKEGNVKNAEALWHQINHSTLYASVWYQMMKLYKNEGYDHQVLELYQEYESLNGEPDEYQLNLVMRLDPSTMKNRANKDIYSKICTHIRNQMNQNRSDKYLSHALFDYHRKINDLKGTIDTFNKMNVKHKNKFICANLMQMYLDNDMNDEVTQLFFSNEIQNHKVDMIDDVTCLLALKACCNMKDERNVKKICNFILNNTKYRSIELFSAIIGFYGRIDKIEKAAQIFDQLDNKHKTVVSCGAMMQAYLQHNMNEEVIRVFFSSQMVDNVSCILALKACTNMKDKENGKKIHKFILNNTKYNYSDHIEVFNALITFYGKIGEIQEAVRIYDSIDNKYKTAVCFGAMMQAYLDNDMNTEVLKLFFEMSSGSSKMINHVSCILALKACGNVKDKENGEQIINFILNNMKDNMYKNIELGNTLITFYGKIGEIEEALTIFHQIRAKNKIDMVCCNAMMQAYLHCSMNKEAIQLFFSNQMYGKSSQMVDDVSCILALKGCSNMKDKENGKTIHNFILNDTKYNCGDNIEVFNALITFYGKIGEIEEAVRIYDSIDNKYKTVVCYGAMMQAYLDNDMNKEVLKLFFAKELYNSNVSCLIALQACGNAKSYYEYLTQIDSKLRSTKQLIQDSRLSSQLISCYGKLGYVKQSEEIFDEYLQFSDDINKQTVTVLSSMMNSYGRNYLGSKSIDLFLKLKHDTMYSKYFESIRKSLKIEDIEITSVLYITLISACSHSSLVNEAKQFYHEYNDYYKIVLNKLKKLNNFQKIKNDYYNIVSNELEIQHSKAHCGLVDAFARKGLLDQAWQFCVKFENNIESEASFLALLSGCRKYNNENMAHKTLKKIENLILSRRKNGELSASSTKSMMAASSVLVQHILTSLGKHDEAKKINSKRIFKKWNKQRGISEIIIPGDLCTVHSFTAGDDYKRNYPNDWKKMDQLWNKWQIELKKVGFKHDDNCMTRQLKESETVEYVLCRHAEKLALAYGVLKIPNKKHIIHINKNMRMCADCHEATKMIAQIEAREIRVADAHAIHIFDGKGNCTCGDYY